MLVGGGTVTVVGGGAVVVVVLWVVVEDGYAAYVLRKNGSYLASTLGLTKSAAGKVNSATLMNFCHIWAGKLPPVTLIPCTLVIGINPLG